MKHRELDLGVAALVEAVTLLTADVENSTRGLNGFLTDCGSEHIGSCRGHGGGDATGRQGGGSPI